MEVRTRALAMAEEREEEAKRRKLFDSGGGGGGGGGEFELSSSHSSSSSSASMNQQQHKNHHHRRPLVLIKSENIPVLPETRVISTDKCSSITSWTESSRCSSNGLCEIVIRSGDIDPERRSEGFRLENSTYFAAGDRARREVTQSSDLINDESNQMPPSSSSETTNLLRNSSKMPSEAEIESFFSEIEKDEQKRFTERYNYDIVKDVPLEGRFVWVPLKL